MKIQRTNLQYVNFLSIPVGKIFTLNNNYYMRITPYEHYNAVNLEKATLKMIGSIDVLPVKGEFIIVEET